MQDVVRTLLILPLLMATSAHAEIFVCKDASGRTITSDRPIPECADRAVREYGNNGVLKKEIAAPLTPEQKREKQQQEEKAKAEQLATDEQKKEDRALAAHYRSEDDIAKARQRDCGLVNEQIAQEKMALGYAEQERAAAQAAIEAQKKKGMAANGLQYRLHAAEQSVRESSNSLYESEAELVQINVKYDRTLERYRQISAMTSANK